MAARPRDKAARPPPGAHLVTEGTVGCVHVLSREAVANAVFACRGDLAKGSIATAVEAIGRHAATT